MKITLNTLIMVLLLNVGSVIGATVEYDSPRYDEDNYKMILATIKGKVDDDLYYEIYNKSGSLDSRSYIIWVITSNGGNAYAGDNIAKLLSSQPTSHVIANDHCLSACSQILLGANFRAYVAGTRVGSHAAYDTDSKESVKTTSKLSQSMLYFMRSASGFQHNRKVKKVWKLSMEKPWNDMYIYNTDDLKTFGIKKIEK